jgi:CRISPR-associated protein Csd1
MIIQSLTKRYETLLASGKLDKPGWSREKVSFALSIDCEGNLKDLIDLRHEKMMGKKQIFEPAMMSVPTPVGKTSGYAPSYMYDGIKYLLGIDKEGITKRSRESFETSRKRHLELLTGCQSPAAKAICK